MKILIVTSRQPDLRGKADQMTLAQAIKFLSTNGILVETCVLKKNSPWTFEFWISVLIGLCVLRPLQSSLFVNRDNKLRIKDLNASCKFDKVYFHLTRTSYYGRFVPPESRYLGLQISQGLNFYRISKELPWGLRRLLYFIESRLSLFYERRVVSQFVKTNLVGTQDLDYLGIRGEIANKVTIIPHGVDVDYQPSSERLRDLIFLANFSSEANLAALKLLEKKIMPEIWRHEPNTTISICGFNLPSDLSSKINDERVVYVGAVDDALATISKHRILLNPVRAAAGMQNKVLAGLAAGVPVVTMKRAVSGMSLPYPTCIACESSPKAFAESVIELLLKYPDKTLLEKVQQDVANDWSWENLHLKWSTEFLGCTLTNYMSQG